MAIRYATELSMPLVNEEGAYIDQWDDELGRLDYWLRADPEDEDSYQQVFMYHPFNEYEMREEVARKAEETKRIRIEQSPDRIDTVESTQASTDEALCDLYEQLLAAQDTIQTQDDAVCELYEMILGTEE